jgi:hypothetical protein
MTGYFKKIIEQLNKFKNQQQKISLRLFRPRPVSVSPFGRTAADVRALAASVQTQVHTKPYYVKCKLKI